jgi:hypothetical protein
MKLCLSHPDQHGAVPINSLLMDLDDFGLQIGEVRVVEVELALEGPIRHTATAMAHLDDMAQG